MNGRKTSIIVSAKAIASQNLAEDKSHPSVRPSVARAWRESIETKIPFLGTAQLRSRDRARGRPTDRPPTALWWESRAQSSHKKAVRYGNALLVSVRHSQIYTSHRAIAIGLRFSVKLFPTWLNMRGKSKMRRQCVFIFKIVPKAHTQK